MSKEFVFDNNGESTKVTITPLAKEGWFGVEKRIMDRGDWWMVEGIGIPLAALVHFFGEDAVKRLEANA